jgi:hypothetical protein
MSFTELKEKYVASGNQRDKLSENAQSLRIKTNSLELQNKEAIAEATESRKALDDFKSGIDKASFELQSALATAKASLDEERRKNASLLQQVSSKSVLLNFHSSTLPSESRVKKYHDRKE